MLNEKIFSLMMREREQEKKKKLSAVIFFLFYVCNTDCYTHCYSFTQHKTCDNAIHNPMGKKVLFYWKNKNKTERRLMYTTGAPIRVFFRSTETMNSKYIIISSLVNSIITGVLSKDFSIACKSYTKNDFDVPMIFD